MKREMSIRSALEWAFGAECASLDFAEDQGDNARPGVSTVWQIMQRGRLGCSIDGGGRSLPAADADIIASAVAALPVSLGGKAMAVQVASLARACAVPDWMVDTRQRIVPLGWRTSKHGEFAQTAEGEPWSWTHRGRAIKRRFACCPVQVVPTSSQIAAARRGYLEWWGALLHLQAQLRVIRALDTVAITRAMPPMCPWRQNAEARNAA